MSFVRQTGPGRATILPPCSAGGSSRFELVYCLLESLEPGIGTAVDAGHLGSPGDQLGAGVVVGNPALDENRTTLVGMCLADRLCQFAGSACNQPKAAAISGVEHIDQAGVVPVLVVVV